MMISISVGEEDRKSLTDTMRVALFRFIPLAFVMALCVILMAVPFTRLYFRDPSAPVYMMTVRGFQILPVCMPLAIICTHFSCYWQTSDRQIPVHILSALDGLIGVVALSALLVPAMKLNGLYVANVLNGLIAPVFVLIYACIYNRHFPRKIDELMSVPPAFGIPLYGRIDMVLHDMESVIGISGMLQQFCEERRIDRRRAFFASLCLEEMVGNVEIASSIHYQNILGMNVLTIRLDGEAV